MIKLFFPKNLHREKWAQIWCTGCSFLISRSFHCQYWGQHSEFRGGRAGLVGLRSGSPSRCDFARVVVRLFITVGNAKKQAVLLCPSSFSKIRFLPPTLLKQVQIDDHRFGAVLGRQIVCVWSVWVKWLWPQGCSCLVSPVWKKQFANNLEVLF